MIGPCSAFQTSKPTDLVALNYVRGWGDGSVLKFLLHRHGDVSSDTQIPSKARYRAHHCKHGAGTDRDRCPWSSGATQPRLTNELQISEKYKVWNIEDPRRWPLLSPQHTAVWEETVPLQFDSELCIFPNLTDSLYEASLSSKQSRKPEEGITRELKTSTHVSQMWPEWCPTHWQQNPAAQGKYDVQWDREVYTRNANASIYENQLLSLIDTGVSSQNRGTTDQRIRKTRTLFQFVKQKTKTNQQKTRRELSRADKGHLWKPTTS